MFSGEICEIFKNTLAVASESLRETSLLNKCLPYKEATSSPDQFKKKLPSSYRKKMRWERGWQLKPSLHLIYFHSYAFATGMANMSPNIFISNVLLKNPTEKMRNEKALLK